MIVRFKNMEEFEKARLKDAASLCGKLLLLENKPKKGFIIDDTAANLTPIIMKNNTFFLARLPRKPILKRDFDEKRVLKSLVFSATRFAAIIQAVNDKRDLLESIDQAAEDMLEMLKDFVPKEYTILEENIKRSK